MSEKDTKENENEGGPLLDGLMLEEGTSNDDASSGGLELDAQQQAELRQIFLTTLPDYLQPIKEMVARLSSEADEDGAIRAGLSKTIALIGEAASRVKLDDVARSMETLREDIVLFGDPTEPQEPLRERIAAEIASLDRLTGGAAASARPPGRSETLVAALRDVKEIDGAVLQKLVAAGVAYVEQVTDADPKEVALVSGLDLVMVLKIVRVLKARRAARSSPPAPASEADAPSSAGGSLDKMSVLDFLDSRDAKSRHPAAKANQPLGAPLPPAEVVDAAPEASAPSKESPEASAGDSNERLARDELALEELRGEAVHLRSAIQKLRGQITTVEQECAHLSTASADARREAAERVAAIARTEAKTAALDREHTQTLTDVEKATSRLAELEAERRAAADELRLLDDDATSLAEHVTTVLDGHSGS